MVDIHDPHVRVRAAQVLLVTSAFAWPATQLTIARHEPPFVLALSWLAIILTALEILLTTDVRKEQDEDGPEAKECANCGHKPG